MALKKKETIYFDRVVRTEKLHTLLALAYSYYYFEDKEEIQESLEYFLNIFRTPPKGKSSGSGNYSGSNKQFLSQYTPALEFGLLKSGKTNELTNLGIMLVEGNISPNQFISNVMLNFFQYINEKPINLLHTILKFLKEQNSENLTKDNLYDCFNESKENRDNINILFDILTETLFFIKNSDHDLKLNPKFSLDYLIKKCNIKMYEKDFNISDYLEVSNQEKYANFITAKTFIVDELYNFKKKADLFEINENISKYEVSKKIDKPHNRIIYGAPGTGKSHLLEAEAKSIFQRRIKKRKITIDDDLSKPNYWIATCGSNNSYWTEFYDGSYFAVGWNELGDLKKYNTKSEMEIWLKKSEDKTLKADSQWAISHRLKKGDYIVIRKGIKEKKVVGYGIVNGDYKLDETLPHFQQSVPVEWKPKEEKILSNYNRNFPITTLVNMNDDLEAEFKKEYLGEDISSEWEEEFVSTVERVTFYDGYTHGQFVGTYKPVPDNDSITYKYIPGPFMKQLIMALKNPEDKFCLIIEEINRARADKVFGNIFQLLDRKNGKSQFPVMLSEDQIYFLQDELSKEYSELFNELLSDGLYIPKNLYIWATMNSADQGVYALDSAFKRRWHFEHIGLDDNEDKFFDEDQTPGIMFQKFKNDDEISHDAISWNKFRHVINKRLLNAKVFEDRLIAPFFVKPTDFIREEGMTYIKENFFEIEEGIFLDKVLMYLFDDVLKHKNKNILFKSEYESFSELKKGYRNTEFDELPNIHSIFKDSLREDLEVISIEEGLSCNKKTITDDSETEEQGS